MLAERTVTSFELRLPWVMEELRKARDGINSKGVGLGV